MRVNFSTTGLRMPAAPLRFAKRFQRSEDGVTAIEFGMVAIPFLMLLFGIIGVGLFFFTTFSLENAVEKASRQIRTGQAIKASKTAKDFKDDVCAFAPPFIDCDNNMRVMVNSSNSFTGAAAGAQPCIDSGTQELIADPDPTGAVPGGANEVVLVTVCYEWELTRSIPFLDLSNMANGSRLIRATTTFKNEPF